MALLNREQPEATISLNFADLPGNHATAFAVEDLNQDGKALKFFFQCFLFRCLGPPLFVGVRVRFERHESMRLLTSSLIPGPQAERA